MRITSKNQTFIRKYPQEQKSIFHSLPYRKFRKGEIIPQTTNNLWLLNRGIVKTLTWNVSGKTVILGYWGVGDVVGLPLSKVDPYEIQCLNTVEATCIPWEQCNYLFKEISECVRQTDELLRIIKTERMYQRLVKFIIWLCQKFGIQVLQGTLIDIRLTHQELADMIGSTRVTVTRLINQLEQEKIIFRPCRFYIIVKNFNLLQEKLHCN